MELAVSAYQSAEERKRAELKVGDTILVTIDGRQIETKVKGFIRHQGSPHVQFCIDWDEGPIGYDWSVMSVTKKG
jgi:hypothetical protein